MQCSATLMPHRGSRFPFDPLSRLPQLSAVQKQKSSAVSRHKRNDFDSYLPFCLARDRAAPTLCKLWRSLQSAGTFYCCTGQKKAKRMGHGWSLTPRLYLPPSRHLLLLTATSRGDPPCESSMLDSFHAVCTIRRDHTRALVLPACLVQ